MAEEVKAVFERTITVTLPHVLVHQGHHDDGSVKPAAKVPIDWPDTEQKWDPKKQPSEVYIAGEPYVAVGAASDGSKVYAHRDVKKR